MNHLHLINKDDNYYAYIPASYNIVKINKFTYMILQLVMQGVPTGEICKKYKIRKEDFDEMKEYFQKLSHTTLQSKMLPNSNLHRERTIERITLHVSNDCNLRCKYCYASGGHYKNDRGLMSCETAKDFVDFCIREFKHVHNIVFFGGEPFMNPSVILYICQMFESKYKEGLIEYLPKFGAITNGTIISSQIMEMIGRYFSFLTISIDGPKDINDANRIDISGTGSYDRIANFIEQVCKFPNLFVQYESTFTDKHRQLGYTHGSIRKFMQETFNLLGEVLEEYNKEKNSVVGETPDFSVSDIISENYPEGFLSILSAIVTKTPKTMCNLYRRNFSISTEGRIFPCHMNTGENNCDLGSITSNNAFTNPEKYLHSHPGIVQGFKNNIVCDDCWANHLCGGCSHLWFYNETDSKYSIFPNRKICEKNLKHIEQILARIGEIREDQTKWRMFKKKFIS